MIFNFNLKNKKKFFIQIYNFVQKMERGISPQNNVDEIQNPKQFKL